MDLQSRIQAIYLVELPVASKAVLFMLAEQAGDDEISVKAATIASMVGLRERQIRTVIASLDARGFIRRSAYHGGNQPSSISVVWPAIFACQPCKKCRVGCKDCRASDEMPGKFCIAPCKDCRAACKYCIPGRVRPCKDCRAEEVCPANIAEQPDLIGESRSGQPDTSLTKKSTGPDGPDWYPWVWHELVKAIGRTDPFNEEARARLVQAENLFPRVDIEHLIEGFQSHKYYQEAKRYGPMTVLDTHKLKSGKSSLGFFMEGIES